MKKYTIGERVCCECEEERMQRFTHEAKERFPSCFGFRVTSEREWYAFFSEWEKQSPPKKQMCFYFLAECGGDGIALCERHLVDAWWELAERCGEEIGDESI